MEPVFGVYGVLSLFGCVTLVLVLTFCLWMVRVGKELKKINQQLVLLQDTQQQELFDRTTGVVKPLRTQQCSKCGKTGKADDLMCVYCHSPFI